MDYLVRLLQLHESFRRNELEALATLSDLKFEWIEYSENVGVMLCCQG